MDYNRGIHAQLKLSDFIAADKTGIVANQWNRLGHYQVGITEEIGLGYGSEKGFEDAQGRVYSILKDTNSNTLQGEVKLVVEDTQGNTILALPFNMDLDYLGNGASNLRDRVEYSFQNIVITRERRIALYVKPLTVGAGNTIDYETSAFSMSVTRVSL
jgi:hypothetical protein